MTLYDIAIVAHEKRQSQAYTLARRLHSHCVAMDDGTIGAGYNHIRAWDFLGEGASEWSIVLEDDAVPCSWFLSGDLKKVLAAAPSPIVSLYLGRSSPRHWQPGISSVIAGDESWLMAHELLHHVAVAIRTEDVGRLTGFTRPYLDGGMPIDEAIGLQCRQNDVMVAYCKPSIVDHDTTLEPVLTDANRKSVWPIDKERRDGDRRAWLIAEDTPVWDNSQVEIPSPVF